MMPKKTTKKTWLSAKLGITLKFKKKFPLKKFVKLRDIKNISNILNLFL